MLPTQPPGLNDASLAAAEGLAGTRQWAQVDPQVMDGARDVVVVGVVGRWRGAARP